jgi:hypothetical protein
MEERLKHFGLPTHVSVTGSNEAMLLSCVKLDSTMFDDSLVSELQKFRGAVRRDDSIGPHQCHNIKQQFNIMSQKRS